MDDAKIVELYWKRDEQAILATSKKYEAYCLSIARNILGDEEDAKECVNDALLGAWNSIPPMPAWSTKKQPASAERQRSTC